MSHFKIVLILLSAVHFNTFAKDERTQTIDHQVWKPFIESWKLMDAKRQVSLYTQDVVRVSEKFNSLENGPKYLSNLKSMMQNMSTKGITSEIKLFFNSRLHRETHAWDSGVYKAVMNHPQKGKMTQYAEFSVLLKREDGKWKIALDSDKSITQQEFEARTKSTVDSVSG